MNNKMTVKDLITELEKIEDKNKEVQVYTFSDIGGWSEPSSNVKVEELDDIVSIESE